VLAEVFVVTEKVVVVRTVTVQFALMLGAANELPAISTTCPVVRPCGTVVVTTHGFALVADVIGMFLLRGVERVVDGGAVGLGVPVDRFRGLRLDDDAAIDRAADLIGDVRLREIPDLADWLVRLAVDAGAAENGLPIVLPANAARIRRLTCRFAVTLRSAWIPFVASSKNAPACETASVSIPVGAWVCVASPSPSDRTCPASTLW